MSSIQKELHLGSLPQEADPQAQILISPYQVMHDTRHEFQDIPCEPDPFMSSNEFYREDQRTISYAKKIVNELGNSLNKEYGWNYSYTFWKILLFPWIAVVVQSLWEQQTRIQNVIKKYSDVSVHAFVVADDANWQFKNFKDFRERGLWTVSYNEWIYSKFVRANAPKTWKVTELKKDVVAAPSIETKAKGPLDSVRKMKRIIQAPVFRRYTHVYGVNFLEALILNGAIRKRTLLPSSAEQYVPQDSETDIGMSWTIDFRKLLSQIIGHAMTDLPSQIQSQSLKYKPGKINLGSQLLVTNFAIQLKSALAVEHGEHIVGIQHGGHGYGSSYVHGVVSETEYSNLGFITWGWQKEGNQPGRFIPLPSPMLSKIHNSHHNTNDQVILVGTSMTPFPKRYTSILRDSRLFSYRKDKISFIESLQSNVRDKLHYRQFYREGYTLEDGSYLRRVFADLPLVNGGFQRAITQCRLVVIDHLSTPLNVVMATNTPMICYWNPSDYPINDEALESFEEMKELGILFHCPRLAAQKVNSIYDQTAEWWGGSEIQAFRTKWIHKYARCSRTWLREWVSALKNLEVCKSQSNQRMCNTHAV